MAQGGLAPARGIPGFPPCTLYVDSQATGAGNGTSWQDAFGDLADALDAALPGCRIRVAEGVYTPDRGTGDPTLSFVVDGSIAVIGGFAGVAYPDPDEHDPALHPTVLSGDLGGSRSLHVVTIQVSVPGARATLRDLTVRKGYANDTSTGERNGAGVLVLGAGPGLRAILAGCLIEENVAPRYGGGVFSEVPLLLRDCVVRTGRAERGGGVYGTLVTLERCRIERNQAVSAFALGNGVYGQTVQARDSLFLENETLGDSFIESRGGAVYCDLGSFVRCSFVGNRTASCCQASGGALQATGFATVVQCAFLGNRAVAGAGSLTAGGAIDASELEIEGSVFSANAVTGAGSGIGGGGACSAASLVARNTTFWGNETSSQGGACQVEDSLTLLNCILWQNSDATGTSESAQLGLVPPASEVSWSCVQNWSGLFTGVGTIGSDPLLVDPQGADGLPGTEDDDLRLLAGSPCIDAGSNLRMGVDLFDLDGDLDVAEPTPVDRDQLPRRVDVPVAPDVGEGAAPLVDMGAHEHPLP